jgi:hypothetical protein
MFTQDIRVHVVDINPAMSTEKMPEAGAVENGSRPDHSPSVIPGTLNGNMSQNVHGITHDEYHPGAFLFNYVINNTANDGYVILEKLESCFPGTLCDARCNYYYLCICVVAWIACTNGYGWEELLPLHQVQNLPLRKIVIPVYNHNLFGQAALSKREAERRPNRACSYDYDFALLH